jgi:hypothetical protein
MGVNKLNIVEYDEIREKLDEVKEACNFLPDVSSDEGYKKSKRVALDVGKVLTNLEAKRKIKKKFFLDGGKEVDTQAKVLAAELESIQAPHKEAYKELDSLKKEREANRKAELEDRVQQMRDLPDDMRDSDSSGIKLAMEAMQAEECLDFYEYSMQALEARNFAQKELGEMYTKALKAEKEAEELEALRAEKEARDKAEYEENLKREAAANAEAEKNEAVKALADVEKAMEQSKLQDKIDSDHELALVMNGALIDEANRAAAEKALKAEQAAREANKQHVSKVRGETKRALMSLGLDEPTAKKIVLAIDGEQIPHVKIAY